MVLSPLGIVRYVWTELAANLALVPLCLSAMQLSQPAYHSCCCISVVVVLTASFVSDNAPPPPHATSCDLVVGVIVIDSNALANSLQQSSGCGVTSITAPVTMPYLNSLSVLFTIH